MKDFEKHLLDDYQRDFPLVPRPYAALAEQLGVSEDQVIAALEAMRDAGLVSRIGAVFKPGALGGSTLAAMSVPEERLKEVAGFVSGFSEVNHNYEREHAFNLWFVVTAPDDVGVERVLGEIERNTGIKPLNLPMLESYHLDLGFPISWT